MAYVPPSERIEQLSRNPTVFHFDGVVTDVGEETVNVRLTGSLTIIPNVPVWVGVDIKKISKNMKVRLSTHNGRRYVSSYFIECDTDLIYEPKGCEDPPPPNMKVEAVAGGVRVTWGKSEGATEYIIYVSDSTGDRIEVGRTTDLEILIESNLPDGYKTFSVVAKDGDCYSENYYSPAPSDSYSPPGTSISPPTPIPETDTPDIPGDEENGNTEGASVCARYESYSLNAPPFYNEDTPYVEVEQHKKKCSYKVEIPASYTIEYHRYRLVIKDLSTGEEKDNGIKLASEFPLTYQAPDCAVNKQYRVRGVGQATSPDPDVPAVTEWSEWTPVESSVKTTQESIGKWRQSEFPREIPMDGSESQFRFRPVGWDGQAGQWTGWLPHSAPFDWAGVGSPIRLKMPVEPNSDEEQLGLLSGRSNVVVEAINAGLVEMIWWNRVYHLLPGLGDCPAVGLAGEYSFFSSFPQYIVIGAPANYKKVCGAWDFEVADNPNGVGATTYTFTTNELPRNLPMIGDKWFRVRGSSLSSHDGCNTVWTPFMKAENHAVFRHVAVGHVGTRVGVLHDRYLTGETDNSEVWLSTFEAGVGGGASVLIHTAGISMTSYVLTIPAIAMPSAAEFYDVEWRRTGTTIVEGSLKDVPVERFPLPIVMPDNSPREYRLCYKSNCLISIALPTSISEASTYTVQLKVQPTSGTSITEPVNTEDIGLYSPSEFPIKYDLTTLTPVDDCITQVVRYRVKAVKIPPEPYSEWIEPEKERHCGLWSSGTIASNSSTSAGEVAGLGVTGLGLDKFFLAFSYDNGCSYAAVCDLDGNILPNSHILWLTEGGGKLSVTDIDDHRAVVAIGSSLYLFDMGVDFIPLLVGLNVPAVGSTQDSGHRGVCHLGDGVVLVAWGNNVGVYVTSYMLKGNQLSVGSTLFISQGLEPCIARLDRGSAIITYHNLPLGTFSPCSGEGGSDSDVGGANIVFVGENGVLTKRENLVWDMPKSMPIYADKDFFWGFITHSLTSYDKLGGVVGYEPKVVIPDGIKWTGLKPVQELDVQDLTVAFHGNGTLNLPTFTPGTSKPFNADANGAGGVSWVGSDHPPFVIVWDRQFYWPLPNCTHDNRRYIGFSTQTNSMSSGFEHIYYALDFAPTVFPYNAITLNGASFSLGGTGGIFEQAGTEHSLEAIGWIEVFVSVDGGVTYTEPTTIAEGCDNPYVVRLPVTYYEDSELPPPRILIHCHIRGVRGIVLWDLQTAIERPPDIYPRANALAVSDPQATKCVEWKPLGGTVTPLDNGQTILTGAGDPGQVLTSRGTGNTPLFVTPVTETAQLRDVQVDNLQDGQAMVFQSATQTFVNKTIPVLEDGVSNGDILFWEDGAYVSTQWPQSPEIGQVLSWDGLTWVAKGVMELLMGNREIVTYPIDVNTLAAHEIVVGQAGKRIMVASFVIVEVNAMKVRWLSGTTPLTGYMDLSVKGNGISLSDGFNPLFALADGQSLKLELAASANNTTPATPYQVGGFVNIWWQDVA